MNAQSRRAATLALLALLALLAFGERPALAHGMLSAYVEVVEGTPGRAVVTTRAQVPVTGLRLVAEAPCTLAGLPDAEDAQVLECPGGTVAGAVLRVEGLGSILGEAVVWARLADGTASSALATRDRPTCELPAPGASVWAVAKRYVRLGVTHIMTGYDHLLFLVGLVLVLRRPRAVLLAETAFTLSHSITFSASALGWVRISPPAVEACIALSLVLVAREATRPRLDGDGGLGGAGLAFVFGLVHGLGFAGGLAEIGLPARGIPAALVGFAGGVEIAQVAFLALVLGLFHLASRVRSPRVPRGLSVASTYAVGAVGFFWLVERLGALLFPQT